MGEDLQPLLDNSPFGQAPKAETTVSAPAEASLEFRSLVVEGGQRYFSVFDASTQRGYWVAEGESKGDIEVSGYDPDNQELRVSQGGRILHLTMKRANIVAGAMPSAVVAAAPTNNATGPRSSQARQSNPADSRRLEAVAEEVRRRRALRQAATTNKTQ